MPLCALPEKLQKNDIPDGDGTDHDNAAQKFWKRSVTAFGPRCPQIPWYKLSAWTWIRQSVPFTSWSLPLFPVLKRWREFPVVLAAFNCPRWMGAEDKSILFVPQFVNRWVWPWTNKGPITVTEMQKENEWFDRGHVTTLPGHYGPSPIQDMSYGWSFQLTWPGLHVVLSFRADAREDGPGVPASTSASRSFWRKMNHIFRSGFMDDPQKAKEFVFFARGIFGRWDSGDWFFVAPDLTVQFDYN